MEGSFTTDYVLAMRYEGSTRTDRWTHSLNGMIRWLSLEKKVQVKSRNGSRVPQNSNAKVWHHSTAEKGSACAHCHPCSSHPVPSPRAAFSARPLLLFHNFYDGFYLPLLQPLTNHKWTHLLLFYILLKSYGKWSLEPEFQIPKWLLLPTH